MLNVPTTLFVNNQDNVYREYEKCHGGEGRFLFRDLIEGVGAKRSVEYIHDDIIPPGSTFGLHTHNDGGEEWYICLSGNGIMTNDGKDYEMKAGDVSVCYAMGTHGIRNTGRENMRILVISGKGPNTGKI